MSECLSQEKIIEITEKVRPHAQERALRSLGFVVLGRTASGKVRCLSTHPDDPMVKAANDQGVKLDLS